MMKFLFCLIFSLSLIYMSRLYFWMVGGLLVINGMGLMSMNFVLVDGVNFSSNIYMDMLSFSLIILSFWITLLMYYSSNGVYSSDLLINYFYLCVMILCVILVFTFSSFNYLSFYFYFEMSLIPTLLIIMGWGYQPERLQAGIYFLFYTITASLPLLMALIYLFWEMGSLDVFMYTLKVSEYFSLIVFMGLTTAFLVKMPMFFTHLWLPKAHVEAPVSGSMILAGILLKLGGFGFFRVMPLCLKGLTYYGGYIFGLSVLGMMYVGMICLRLNDLKALVAYSSVAHMGLVICGVYSMFVFGYTGSLVMMVGHGLASSGLFCIVNMFYERSGSRSIFLNKGLILMLPVMTLLIFLLSAANMAAPPTLNLMSEIFLMMSMLKFENLMLLVFPLASYLGAVFTLFMFSFSQHGKIYKVMYSYLISGFREYHTLWLHVIPVNFLILKPEYFLLL